MTNKCCRFYYHSEPMTRHFLSTIRKKYGNWDLTKKDEGFPCIHLKDEKCSIYEDRLEKCIAYPRPDSEYIKGCSIKWINGVKPHFVGDDWMDEEGKTSYEESAK